MSHVIAEHLKAGIIFGDHESQEYIYLPGGEVGVDIPLCILERKSELQDISLEDAINLVYKLSLKPIRHAKLGNRSY